MASRRPPTGTPATRVKGWTRGRRNDCARLISCCMSLLATRKAVGLLIRTLGFTKTGELTADSLTVKFPNFTPPRSNKACANQRLSRDCSFATSLILSRSNGLALYQYTITCVSRELFWANLATNNGLTSSFLWLDEVYLPGGV